MKPIALLVALLILLTNAFAQRCSTTEYIDNLFKINPAQQSIYKSNKQINYQGANNAFNAKGASNKSVRFIPVVIHVVYKNATENISTAQIQSQIDILNHDYLGTNNDAWKLRQIFHPIFNPPYFQFYLADTTITGMATTGIVRKATTHGAFTLNDDMKHSNTGGDSAWDSKKYLNIWVCNLSSGILGYATLPNTATPDNEGVVIDFEAFGNTGAVVAPYDKGRSATHEIGHYFGLNHPFDGGCTNNNCATDGDEICDTPPEAFDKTGCQKNANTCSTESPDMPDLVEAFMGYSDDACMCLFTKDQSAVMRSVLANTRSTLGFDSIMLVSDNTVGANDLISLKQNEALSMYPNPSTKQLTIYTHQFSIASIEVVDIFGRILNCKWSIINTDNCQLNTENLPLGIYFIKAIDGAGNSKLAKFVKE